MAKPKRNKDKGRNKPRGRKDKSLKRPKEEKDDSRKEFEVEKIIKRRGTGTEKEWLLKWKGFNESHNSWERDVNCPALIKKYERAERRSRSAKRRSCSRNHGGRSRSARNRSRSRSPRTRGSRGSRSRSPRTRGSRGSRRIRAHSPESDDNVDPPPRAIPKSRVSLRDTHNDRRAFSSRPRMVRFDNASMGAARLASPSPPRAIPVIAADENANEDTPPPPPAIFAPVAPPSVPVIAVKDATIGDAPPVQEPNEAQQPADIALFAPPIEIEAAPPAEIVELPAPANIVGAPQVGQIVNILSAAELIDFFESLVPQVAPPVLGMADIVPPNPEPNNVLPPMVHPELAPVIDAPGAVAMSPCNGLAELKAVSGIGGISFTFRIDGKARHSSGPRFMKEHVDEFFAFVQQMNPTSEREEMEKDPGAFYRRFEEIFHRA